MSLGESSKRFNVYFDGFNLYKGTLEKRPNCKWLDLISLSRSLYPKGIFLDAYYFTAGVKARFLNDRASDRQHSYLRALESSGVKVVRGKFHKSEKWKRLVSQERDQTIQPPLRVAFGITQRLINDSWLKSSPDVPKAKVYDFEEKGSDVNLASYLLRDVFKRKIDMAFVVTGDSDLVNPIRFATEAGIPVHVLVPGNGQNMNDLRSVATNLLPLDIPSLLRHQFPEIFVTPKGRQIRRPDTWR